MAHRECADWRVYAHFEWLGLTRQLHFKEVETATEELAYDERN